MAAWFNFQSSKVPARREISTAATIHRVDFLVVGSGIAGLTYALRVAESGTVVVLTKGNADETGTRWAQGGIASVMSDDDDFASHVQDTLVAGDGLCHRDVVETLVQEGPSAVRELIDWGVRFTRLGGRGSDFDLHREGGHHKARILHAGDITGAEIERALLDAARAHPNIQILERRFALELVTQHFLTAPHDDVLTCHGAYALDRDTGRIETWLASRTVVCTGGVGQVYQHTTNPTVSTGDGIAMAWRAGARVANMEFLQFHPTALFDPMRGAFLISEAVRGAGAFLVDSRGERFMEKEHPLKDLAPRDIVSRAIDRRMKALGDPCVYLDATSLGSHARTKFPNIRARCLEAGIRMEREPIPVTPSAHYLCGGIQTDLHGRTSIRGLYACGECAHTGVHGANRLASNSLLEAVVFSRRAAEHSMRIPASPIPASLVRRWDRKGTQVHREEVVIRHLHETVRRTMWDFVGIVRTTDRLQRAATHLRLIRDEVEDFYKRTVITPSLLELRNAARVARLITECALRRHESRGLHSSLDFPNHAATARDTVLKHRV
jgi:L-aspartate oxidase